jgi:hypothetical protein
MIKNEAVRFSAFLAVVLLSLTGAGGCGKSSTDAPPGRPVASASGKGTVVSNGGAFTVSYQTTPDPIPTNEPFDLKFTVTPKQAPAPGTEFKVEVDARMPAHFHGMNRAPKLSRRPDGSYTAEGMLFHMPGHWELFFDVSQAGRTERAQVDIVLK